MKLRHWLYVGLIAIVIFSVGGVLWLSQYREFADPTWLDHSNALTVQAAWAQAVFSVIAIVVAIALGEIQHGRTRLLAEDIEKRRLDDEKSRAVKAAIWIVYALDGEQQNYDLVVSIIETLALKDDDETPLSDQERRAIGSVVELLRGKSFMNSIEAQSKVELLSGASYEATAKASASLRHSDLNASVLLGTTLPMATHRKDLAGGFWRIGQTCREAVTDMAIAKQLIMGAHNLRQEPRA